MMNPQSDKALMNKVEALQKEFAEIDINHDANISRDELYSYLDRKTKSRFDRAIADELFDHMDKDQNQFITINEFIRVYIEADEMLQKKIATAKANLINYKRQQEEYSKKAQEERAVEKPNQYGIANDSAIYVTVVEAGFTNAMAAPSNPYVEISLDDQQRVRTRVVQGGKQPMWDEKVTLDVFNPGSILRFIVFESRNVGDDVFVGEIAVEINDLQDQNLHDVTLNLFDQRANNEIGTLHLNLQWIHSKATYFEALAQKWIETYRNEEEELKEYERYLANLYQPFPTLLMPQSTGSGTQAPLGGSQPAPTTLLDRKILAMMNQAARNITQDHPSDVFWKGLLTLLCQVEIILAILIGFGRATFVDLLLTTLVFLEVRKEIFRNIISLKQMALGILLSAVVLDIVWLWTYSGNWTNVESFDVDAEGGTRSFVVFFSYVNVIVKLIFSIVCYTFSLHGH